MSASKNSTSMGNDIKNVIRGLLMGAADIVPGVSGGTVALILGHYERLIKAISRIDVTFLKLVFSGKIKSAIEHTDLRFLIALAIGIGAGVIGLASLMNHLLDTQLSYTYALFSGLIIASAIVVCKTIKSWSILEGILLIVGVLVAIQISVLQPLDGNLTLPNVFAAGCVAICAMILPGISGAFVLLLLGMYHPITEMLKAIPKGEFTAETLATVTVFCAGCLTGLLTFSRFLKYLLANFPNQTMSFLVGLMIGSLYKIWPFQTASQDTMELEFKDREFVRLTPWESESNWMLVALLVAFGFVLVIAIERLGKILSPSEVELELASTDDNQGI